MENIMENNMFAAMDSEELFDVTGGDLFRDIGYFCHAWVDFWGGVGEGIYDGTH